MIPTIDYDKMNQDLNWIRRIARRVVELPIEMGVEDLSNAEIRKETEDLVKRALLKIIRRYQLIYWKRTLITPEILYEYLWCLIYFALVSRTDKTDVYDKMKELLVNEQSKICDFIDNEYDRRLTKIKKQKDKEEQQ